MKEHKRYYRSRLLEMFMEKKFSPSTDCEIMHLFKNIPENQKEAIAQKMISIIEQSRTEQEAIQKARQVVEQTQ